MDEIILLVFPISISLFLIMQISFAIGVYADSVKLKRCEIVPPFAWALAALIGGVFAVGIYWVIHRSVLSPHNESREIKHSKHDRPKRKALGSLSRDTLCDGL